MTVIMTETLKHCKCEESWMYKREGFMKKTKCQKNKERVKELWTAYSHCVNNI